MTHRNRSALAQGFLFVAVGGHLLSWIGCSTNNGLATTRIDCPVIPPLPSVSAPAASADADPPPAITEDASASDEIINPCQSEWPVGPLSSHVPNRDCSKDYECGDGFCDRGICAVIWREVGHYGQRCTKDWQCDGICLDGRCRSCLFHAECAAKADGYRYVVCGRRSDRPGALGCGGESVHGPFTDINVNPDISPRKIVPKPAVP